MLFNSLNFLIFLAIVLFLYYILPQRLKWILLLIGSTVFYMAWRLEFIFLILFSTILNYFSAKLIEDYREKAKKILTFALILNFLLLFIFKYLVFISNTFKGVYEYFGLIYPIKDFNIILPMGISFYTFQAVSYIIDVYRNRYPAERNYFKSALYIMFFPQLVAGPIERADRLLGQLFSKKVFNVKNISIGLKIMLIGYFKKVVIADRVAVLVNSVYNSPFSYTGISFLIATVFFAFQIYCDFSGYSDIAIGCAKLFGIDLMENFKKPYFSKNIKEFWERWHISLSSWFKDYLYIPLGGNKKGVLRTYFNTFITFLISGLWHGANWTFVFWGAINGIYQIIGSIKFRAVSKINFRIKSRFISHILNFIKIIITFLLICFAWIFFRANSISEGLYIASNLFNDIQNIFNIQYLYNILGGFGLNIFEIMLVSFCILILILIEFFEKDKRIYYRLEKLPFFIRFAFYYVLIVIILSTGGFNNAGEFIYFQF